MSEHKKLIFTYRWPFYKSKFNLKSYHVNLVEPASPIECLLYFPNTVQTGTGKVDPARKFKCTTAAREIGWRRLCKYGWEGSCIRLKRGQKGLRLWIWLNKNWWIRFGVCEWIRSLWRIGRGGGLWGGCLLYTSPSPRD